MKPWSIRRRLVLLLSLSLAAVWVGMLAWSYVETREEVGEQADDRLEEAARTIMLLDLNRLAALAGDGAARGDDGDGDDDDDDDRLPHLRFQVWDRDGTLRLRSAGAPAVAYLRRDGHAALPLARYNWHTFAAYDVSGAYQVRVFEKPGLRGKLVNKTARRMAEVLLVGLPVLALFIWFSVGDALRPLRSMSAALALRHVDNLEAMPAQRVPAETQVLVEALNRLLERLRGAIGRERAFTADAAHELRTPLAAIKVQAEVALAAHDAPQRAHAIGQIIVGVNRLTHLVRQLLLLARLDQPLQDAAAPGMAGMAGSAVAGAVAGVAAAAPVDLAALAVDCAARRAGDAVARDIELEVEGAPGCLVRGDAVSLSVLLDNLLDNAIKYGRPGGRIAIASGTAAGQCWLRVSDDGPGVDGATLARLTQRFYRADGNRAEGSGLGLSIVEKIAQAHHAELLFGAGIDGRGLGATVRFSAAAAGAAA